MDTSDLAKRMKEYYEGIPKTKLMRRCPVAIRLDGKAFHTYTKGFNKPFDEILIKTMQETTKYLCENIQGCVLGYTQSDEITLILVDYKKLNSSAWFDYEVQKMCSVAASMATMAFNQIFSINIHMIMSHIHYGQDFDYTVLKNDYGLTDNDLKYDSEFWNTRLEMYQRKMGTAMFDARCFNIPKEEVTNLVYWRQLDAIRNSIQMVGQANFSHKELQHVNCNMIKDMLMKYKNINWDELPVYQQRGSCCIRNHIICEPYGNRMLTNEAPDGHWFIDKEIPIFKDEGREYIEKLINFD